MHQALQGPGILHVFTGGLLLDSAPWCVSTKRKEGDTIKIFKFRDWMEMAIVMTKAEFKTISYWQEAADGTLTIGVKDGQ